MLMMRLWHHQHRQHGDAPALELEDIDLFMKQDLSSPPEIPEAPWKQGEVLHRQTLILLYNMNKALKNLPLNHRKQIRTLVGAPPAEKVDLAASIIAALTGTSSRTVAKVVAEVGSGHAAYSVVNGNWSVHPFVNGNCFFRLTKAFKRTIHGGLHTHCPPQHLFG